MKIKIGPMFLECFKLEVNDQIKIDNLLILDLSKLPEETRVSMRSDILTQTEGYFRDAAPAVIDITENILKYKEALVSCKKKPAPLLQFFISVINENIHISKEGKE